MRSRYWVLACLTFVTLAACGDDEAGDGSSKNEGDSPNDEGGGNTTVDTGLPATVTLSSLSDEDAQQVCMSTAHTFNTVLSDSRRKEVGCMLFAITSIVSKNAGKMSASDVPTCEKVTKDCVDGKTIDGKKIEVEIETTADSMCDTGSAEASFGDCKATVADYESCANKLASELRERFEGVSCDALSDLEKLQATLEIEIDISNAAECKELRAKCPRVDLAGESDAEIDTGDKG